MKQRSTGIESNPNASICQETVFNEFFKAQARLLRNYLFYKYGDEEAANDVVQEAFIKLWNNCANVPLEKAKSYLYTVASNLSTNVKRHERVKLKYTTKVVNSGFEYSSESPEFVMLEKEFMEKLTHSIDSLPDRQREVFLLNRIEKKTYKEIAEMSGVSVKAVEKLMHKALLKLKSKIGDNL